MDVLQLQLSRADLLEMGGQLATDLLGCRLIDEPDKKVEHGTTKAIACSIELSGTPSNFEVAVMCRASDAKLIAARMTGKAPEGLTDELVCDALGEWLNICAGQVNSLGGLDHALGLPRAVAFADTKLGGQAGVHVCFEEIGAHMWIGLLNAQLRS